jgi:hypothetical protein
MFCASIHHKALLEGTLGSDVTVGCVLILKQVLDFLLMDFVFLWILIFEIEL